MDLAKKKRILWILLATFGLLRLVWFVVDFGRNSLQMDLAAYWVAGSAVDVGLSPYQNHLLEHPELWDGVASYQHSRFFYPPLVARLFQPFAYLPYAAFKYLWMIFSLAAIGMAVRLSRKSWRDDSAPWVALFAASTFFPLWTLLERGQVDGWTLLLITLAFLAPRGESRSWIAGGGLALAIALKLHVLFVLPFLIWTRRWRLLGGIAVGGAALLLVSVAVDGEERWKAYLGDELPRISRYGEGGPRESWLNPLLLERARENLAPGKTLIDGKQYDPERLQFALNASLARSSVGRVVWNGLRQVDWRPTRGRVALVLLTILLGVTLATLRGRPPTDPLLNMQLALTTASLAAPLTWTMNLVWLLPVIPLLLNRAQRRTGLPFALILVGFVLAALPGSLVRLVTVWEGRFVVAQLLIWVGLLALARREATDEAG
jgi:hypothetical protein